ncbi:MAG: sigma-70 family RNA polymerase sigma factor [Phycisphaerae bacterium]|nr:sigma-70 family RNA polymerase sigma factor [Phycisphaerae bacterium]
MNEPQQTADIERVNNGDADALQRLLVHYHNPLCRALSAAVGPRLQKHLDPEDVLQDAYVAAFRSIAGGEPDREDLDGADDSGRRPHFDDPAALFKWLERVALNQLRDAQRHLRRQKRDIAREAAQPADTPTSYPNLLDRIARTESTPSGKLAKAESIAAVMTSLARLTDDQRDVIRMRFLEARPVADVAQKLKKTEAAIHMLCHRGLKALREQMVSISRHISGT